MFAIIANILLASKLHYSENKIFSGPFLFFKELANLLKNIKISQGIADVTAWFIQTKALLLPHTVPKIPLISHYFSTRPEKSTNVMKEYYKQLISNLSWCLCRCYWPMLTALFHSYFVISFIHTQTRRQGTFSAWCQGSTFSPICMSYQVHRITDSHSRTENGLVFKHEQWMYFPNVSAEFNNAIQLWKTFAALLNELTEIPCNKQGSVPTIVHGRQCTDWTMAVSDHWPNLLLRA